MHPPSHTLWEQTSNHRPFRIPRERQLRTMGRQVTGALGLEEPETNTEQAERAFPGEQPSLGPAREGLEPIAVERGFEPPVSKDALLSLNVINLSSPKCLPFRSIEQTTEVLLCLSPGEAADLKEGINFLRNKKTGKDFILYKSKNCVRACKNVCKHQGVLFIKDIEDLDGRYRGF